GGSAMRCPSKEFLRISVLLCGIALAANAQAPTPPAQAPTKTVRAVQNFVTVTDQTLRAPSPQDWPIHRGNYQAWGYSPLDQINFVSWDNVVVSLGARSGEVVWQANRGGDLEVSNSTGPIVANGVVIAGTTC